MSDGEDSDSYTSVNDSTSVSDKYKREMGRLRSSPTFRLSILFTSISKNPFSILWLPLSIVNLLFTIVSERLGKKPSYTDSEAFETSQNNRNCIVFFPTNGVGFGHLTRTLAIARRMRYIDPSLEIVFFTTMPVLHILQDEGFPAYHIPNRDKFNKMEANVWNSICEELISNIFTVHRPKAFVFDGSYPYRGMLNAIKRRDDIVRAWIRRGSFKVGASSVPSDSFNHFDLLIRPGDSVEITPNEVEIPIPLLMCDPVTLFDKNELKSPEILRNRLGIPLDSTVAYLQLGAGKINDIFSDIAITIDVLKEFGVWVVIGESMLGDRIENSEFDNVRIIRDYPNSQYFDSFDFGIISGGYNSFHEAISFQLPCICIPNKKTGIDNQYARAAIADESGCMFIIDEVTRPKMKILVSKIVEENTRSKMSHASKSLKKENGASQIATHILDLFPNSVD